MTLALVCVDPARIESILDGAAAAVAPSFAWLILHVIDTRPVEEWSEIAGRLAGRGPARERAAARIHDAAERGESEIRAAIAAWLAGHGRAAEIVQIEGRPERAIVQTALDRGAALIVLGKGEGPAKGRDKPPPPPEPRPDKPPPHAFGPPRPPGPVARFVIDHAPVDVLLLRDHEHAW